MPAALKRRTDVSYKFKTYKDGKVLNVQSKYWFDSVVENWEDAFPCKGDKKWKSWSCKSIYHSRINSSFSRININDRIFKMYEIYFYKKLLT